MLNSIQDNLIPSGVTLLYAALGLKHTYNLISYITVIQLCSGITCGRVLNGEHYAHRLQKLILSAVAYSTEELYEQTLQKLIYLHLLTESRLHTYQ